MMSSDNNKISIIMGLYNCSRYLSDAIDSILNQTYENWELILCDDGSTDSSYVIAKSYQQLYPDKIVLLRNRQNKKLNYTLNKCLNVATGKYIARMDGDDICAENRLEKEIKFLENHLSYAFVGTQMNLFNDRGVWGRADFPVGAVDKHMLLNNSSFCHASILIRTSVLKSVGGYSIGKRYIRVEDYDLWYLLYKNGYKGYNLPEALYSMRDDEDACHRRTFQNRINEMLVKMRIFHDFGLPVYKLPIVFKPIVLWLLPSSVYNLLRKKRLGK